MGKRQAGQQNAASDKVRREPNVIVSYTANGPTLDVLLKALLRTAALLGVGQ